MTRVSRYDGKETILTNEELSKKVQDSIRCCTVEEDLFKFIIHEMASHGSPHDVKIWFCVETQCECARITDSERVWEEVQKKGIPMRWDREASRWVEDNTNRQSQVKERNMQSDGENPTSWEKEIERWVGGGSGPAGGQQGGSWWSAGPWSWTGRRDGKWEGG